ncbi:MAG: cell wall hydrolase [Sphingopyxis sp.]|nr:cell wall hydrolase [Sphingopyxis sp.]
MSRILNVASLAAVVLTATAMLALTEPGQASDLAAASVAPVVLPQPAAPVGPETQEQAPAGNQSETETEPAPAPEPVRATSLADLVAATPMPEAIDEELRCLAGAVYFESRSESLAGQLAVAHVVINRTESGRFPRTMCGVVYQKSQFSFVRGGQMPPINTAHRQWRNAVAVAQIARDGSWDNAAPGALFFHARHVSPGWNRPRIAQIDNHIFYR